MSKREAIYRYSLIIKRLRKSSASFREISDYLKRESQLQEYNFDISVRTFQRDLNDIRTIYDIDITYDSSRKQYCIEWGGPNELQQRIMEAFDTLNALNLTDELADFIHFEKRKTKGTENLYSLLHAIKNCFRISFSYQKFWEDEPSARRTEPYALKEFKNRWYLLARDIDKDELRIYGLDRLSELSVQKTGFQVPVDLDVQEYFRNCFGIIIGDKAVPETVILSFIPEQGKYIKSLPLHESQNILVDNDDELRVELRLHVTFDFVQELLSFGERVKVIQPESLIEEVVSSYEKSLSLYR